MSPHSRRSSGLRIARFLLLFGALGGSLSASFAQQPKVLAPHRPLKQRLEKRLPWDKPTVRQSATGGLWMTDANWKASLHLKNGLKADPITVTPILYLSNGQRYPLSPVTLEPSGTAIVDIGQGLASVGIAPYATLSGYAEIEYQWPWSAVTATVKNVDVVNSLIYLFGLQPSPDWHPEHMESMPVTLPASFEGLWWKQEKGVSGFLALSNVTGQAIHAAVRLTDQRDAPLASYQVTVSPHGTKMLTLDELKTTASDSGGVYLTHDGPERGLHINGGLQDQAAGYSAHLPMRAQPQPSSASQPQAPADLSISELGLMTGAADPMMNFPSGTVFAPYSLVRNTSEQPATVTPELWWMAGGSPQSATLPQMTILPHQTVNLNAPSLLAAAGLKDFNGSVNLILDTKAQPGGLVMSGGSVDQKNTYVFEVIPHGIAEGAAKALCYWSTGNGDDTMVTLWNPADEPQDLAFTLFYTGGQYAYPIQLGPRETRTLNVSEILHSSIPDPAGNVIPAGITEGSAEIAGSLGEHQHVLISVDAGVYNVRKATCGNYCWNCSGVVYAAITLAPFAVAVSGTTGETFYETHDSGYQYSTSASWSSSATGVATVNSSGVVTGVNAGSLTLSAADLYYEIVAGPACSDQYTSCPTANFNGSAPGTSVSVSVTFSNTPIVPLGGTAQITATVAPASNTASIKLTLSTTSGTGSAIFSNSQTTMTITSTNLLSVVGVTGSSVPNNISLTATVGSKIVGSTSFSVAATNGAIPVNFMQTSASRQPGGVLEFQYTWGSSSGNMADLSQCQMEEYVTYPYQSANPLSYFWTSPPYAAGANSPNPDTGRTPGPASGGLLIDDHGVMPFQKPYVYNSFAAQQVYQFRCPYYKANQWIPIFPLAGTNAITRTVSQSGSNWLYTITKTGLSNSAQLP